MKLTPQERAQARGLVTGARSRAASYARYLKSPNICQQCQETILPRDGERVADIRVRKFCNRSCAARFNNAAAPKRKSTYRNGGTCESCGTHVHYKPRSGGSYTPKRFCAPCLSTFRAKRRGVDQIAKRTKGELFENRAGYQSARSSIRQHAYSVYASTGKPFSCAVCGYEKHAPVCHKRPVADFPDEAKVEEINAIDNLVALCPNHHWEMDHGMLIL